MRKVTVISMVVLAISLSFSVIGCLFIMNQGNVSDIITLKAKAELVESETSSETKKDGIWINGSEGLNYETVKVVGEQYTYYWTFSEDEITSMPTELSMDIEDAIDIAKKGIKDSFQYKLTNKTVIDTRFYASTDKEEYNISFNDPYYGASDGEDNISCYVNAITGELVSIYNRDVEGAYDDEDELWQYDEEGNKIGFNLPDFFTDSNKLDQLKEESEGIATSFIEQLGIYDISELTYLKTEAYETAYPWTLEAMFAKGEQEIVSVSILANNLKPYQYRIFTREPLISY